MERELKGVGATIVLCRKERYGRKRGLEMIGKYSHGKGGDGTPLLISSKGGVKIYRPVVP